MRKKEKPVCLLLHTTAFQKEKKNLSTQLCDTELGLSPAGSLTGSADKEPGEQRKLEEGEGTSFFPTSLFPPSTWLTPSTQAEEVGSRFQLPSTLPEPAPGPPFRLTGACTPRSECQLLKIYALSSWGASSSQALSCPHRDTLSPLGSETSVS